TKNSVRNAIMLREVGVQERVVGVEDVDHRAVVLEEVSEETNGFLIHRRAQGCEGGEVALAFFAQLIEVVDVQPSAGELSREASHARIAEHAARLRGEHTGIVELAACGERPQFRIGSRGPKEITEAA